MKTVRLPKATQVRLVLFNSSDIPNAINIISPYIIDQVDEGEEFTIEENEHEFILKKDGSRYYIIRNKYVLTATGYIEKNDETDRIYLNSNSAGSNFYDTITNNFKNTPLGKLITETKESWNNLGKVSEE